MQELDHDVHGKLEVSRPRPFARLALAVSGAAIGFISTVYSFRYMVALMRLAIDVFLHIYLALLPIGCACMVALILGAMLYCTLTPDDRRD